MVGIMARTTKKFYEEGKEIGNHGLILVKELDPVIHKTYKERMIRCICPICGEEFDTALNRVLRSDTGKKKPVSKCQKCSLIENNKRISELGKKSSTSLLDQKFGKLTVIKQSDIRGGSNKRSIMWECKCDCGNPEIVIVSTADLKRGHVRSCGCMKSNGERLVQESLIELNIKYKKEYTFDDCINPLTEQKLRFDFYLPEYNTCIEYDGEQHFIYSNNGWNNKENFDKTQYRDSIKNNYCKNNNIRLIRISYVNEDKINKNYILSLLQGPIS